MSLLDYFRPKWRSSDPEVRAEAVRDLDNDDRTILEQIARRDRDVKVRRLAIRKLSDPSLLGDIAKTDPDDGLRRMAAEMATTLLVDTASSASGAAALRALAQLQEEPLLITVARNAVDAEVRAQALSRLKNDVARGDVARGARDEVVRNQALAAISDKNVLRSIALEDTFKDTAAAALAGIDDLKALEEIAEQARNKAVRKLARTRLETLAPPTQTPARMSPSPEQLQQARRVQLIRNVEQLAARTDFDAVAAELATLGAEWQQLGPPSDADAALGERYARAERRVHEHRAVYDAAAAAAERRVEEEREREAERARRIAAERERTAAAKAERERKAEEAQKQRQERAAAREAAAAQTTAQAQRNEEAEAAAQQIEREENRTRMEALCIQLEALGNTEDRKLAEKELKQAQASHATLGALPREQAAALRDRFQAARERVVMRMRELEEVADWQRWANATKLEQLCQRVEALRDEKDQKKVAAELRRAQAEWKEVGPAPKEKSQALWQRFRTVCTEVGQAMRAHFAQLEEGRKENVAKKEALCVQAETISAARDWKTGGEALKALQQSWKEIGPVPKKDADALWQRFRAACDSYFAARKEHFSERDEERTANLKKKESLCAEAEAVAGSSDWREALRVIRNLQKEWKTIGHVPRTQADAVWKRFRGACDRVYEQQRLHDASAAAKRAEEEGGMHDAREVQASWRPATLGDVLKAVSPAASESPPAVEPAAPSPATAPVADDASAPAVSAEPAAEPTE